MMKSAKRKLYYMTPKLVQTPVATAEITQGPIMLNVPVDRISQVVRRQTVRPDPPTVGHLAVAMVLVGGLYLASLAYGLRGFTPM